MDEELQPCENFTLENGKQCCGVQWQSLLRIKESEAFGLQR